MLRLLDRIAERVAIVHRIQVCCDPQDDKFLELAVNGDSNLILTGDRDLLVLDAFHEIEIKTPAAYLATLV